MKELEELDMKNIPNDNNYMNLRKIIMEDNESTINYSATETTYEMVKHGKQLQHNNRNEWRNVNSR